MRLKYVIVTSFVVLVATTGGHRRHTIGSVAFVIASVSKTRPAIPVAMAGVRLHLPRLME